MPSLNSSCSPHHQISLPDRHSIGWIAIIIVSITIAVIGITIAVVGITVTIEGVAPDRGACQDTKACESVAEAESGPPSAPAPAGSITSTAPAGLERSPAPAGIE